MKTKSFSEYLTEETKEVFFTFGRMNPPTIGHGKLMNVMSAKAGKNPYMVYLSHSNDPKKNPLTYQQKIKYVRKMFPKHSRNIIMDKTARNVFEVASKLYDKGFNRINMIVGADRIREFEMLLKKYNGVKGRHGFYNFEQIKVISAGERDPDAEGVEGMSASKQRANAQSNDFTTFSQGVPTSMSNRDAKALFNDLRRGMGLKETSNWRQHVELEPVSEMRERFVEGGLFLEGDRVSIKENGKEGYVHRIGTNYVIIALDEGRISRQWIDSVQLVDIELEEAVITKDKPEQERLPDEGTDEASARACKITPGHDIKKLKSIRKRKVNEEVSQKQINDLEKFADRLLNKFGIDIEFTRHFADRMNDKRNDPVIKIAELQKLFKKIAKNKGTKIKAMKNAEAVLKDIQTDLNLPIVINFKNGEFEVVNKTIMRKPDFKTSNQTIKYEQTVTEDEVSNVRSRIEREQERDRKRYDAMLDRARIRRATRKGRETKAKDVNL